MSFRDLLIIKTAIKSVISITAAMVIVLGSWIVFSEMLSVPSQFENKNFNYSFVTKEGRAPASIRGFSFVEEPAKALNEIKVETLNLSCVGGQNKKFQTKSAARQVRIKLRPCDGTKAVLENSSLINRSTGYEATLFHLEKGYITSDYISLAEGENNILVQLYNPIGEKISAEIHVTQWH